MNDHDELDVLERELGESLRLGLRRAAAEITEEHRPDAPARRTNRSATDGTRFDDADLEALEPLEPPEIEVTVVNLEPTPRERAGRRRWLVAAAAAAAAVVLIVGSVLVWAADHDAGTPVPAGPGRTSTTVDLSRVVDERLPPEGARPSIPETGELVATIAFSRFNPDTPSDVSINLFADGRLIWLPTDDVPRGVSERRLNDEGVERVRREFLAIGVTGRQPADSGIWSSCSCIIRVRDGGGLLSSAYPPSPEPETPVDPQLDRRIDHLIEYVTDLESSLPESAWADREIRPYVPSKYRVEVRIDGGVNQAVPDLSKRLAQLLPTPLVERLDAQGWVHTPWGDSVDLTLADARELAVALVEAGVNQAPASGTLLVLQPQIADPVPTHFSISFYPLLPDGELALMAPG